MTKGTRKNWHFCDNLSNLSMAAIVYGLGRISTDWTSTKLHFAEKFRRFIETDLHTHDFFHNFAIAKSFRMMNLKLILAAATLILLPSAACGQTRQWSLDDCINYALENNISLKKDVVSARSASEDVKQSKAALLPSLSFGTNHSLGYRPWTNSGVVTVANGTAAAGEKTTYYNGSYSLNANWTVWNGGKNVNQVKMNRLTEREAALDSAITANSIQEQIAQLYVQSLYLKEAISVSKNNSEVSRANEERGKHFVEAGKISKADLAQLTSQRSQDEYTVVEAQSALTTCLVRLKQVLELPGDAAFDVCDFNATDDQALAPIPSLADVYACALEQRPEIKRGALQIEGGALQEKMAKAGYMPTIGLTAGAGTSTNSMNQLGWSNQMKTNFDMQLGVSVSVPIYDQRQTRTAVNKARFQQEMARLDLLDQQKTLYSTIENYWEQAITSQQKFVAARENVSSMQTSYELLEQQFQLGLKNVIELMTMKANLLQAQQTMLESKYTAVLNIQMLNFYKSSDNITLTK